MIILHLRTLLPHMAKTVYNRIKAVLAEKSVTSIELANALCKRRETISRWCTNESQPTIEGLFEIANFLNVDVRDLLVPNKKPDKN